MAQRRRPGFWQGFALPLMFLLSVFVVSTVFYYASVNSDSLLEKVRDGGESLSAQLVAPPAKAMAAQQGEPLVLLSKQEAKPKAKQQQLAALTATTEPATRPVTTTTVQNAKIPVSDSPLLGSLTTATQSPAPKLKQLGAELSFGMQSVSFPNVESWLSPDKKETRKVSEYQPYQYFRPLLQSIRATDGSTRVIPNVSCHKYAADFVANRARQYAVTVAELSAKYRIDRNLIMAVIAQESCFKYNATSAAGAQGLMQLMPDTATFLNIKDAYDPVQNIDGGIRYLSQLKKEFSSDELVLAAYNSGPGTVRRSGGVPDYPETSEYIRKVFAFRNSYRAAAEALQPAKQSSPCPVPGQKYNFHRQGVQVCSPAVPVLPPSYLALVPDAHTAALLYPRYWRPTPNQID